MTDTRVLSVQNVSLVREGNTILKNITFDVKKGEYVALIGPNGSGKTSLLRVILGLYPATEGKIELFGTSLGYVPQKLDMDKTIPISVKEFFGVYHKGFRLTSSIISILEELGVLPLLEKQLGVLSGGEIQKILIANAILSSPDLLILDEPTAGIDAIGEKHFYEFIEGYMRSKNASVVLVSHDMHMVYQYASQVICLKTTIACQGTPEVVQSCTAFQEMFGTNVSHVHHHHS